MPMNKKHRQALIDGAYGILNRGDRASPQSVEWAEGTISRLECGVEACRRPHSARGMCHAHYARMIRGVTVSGPIGDRRGRQPGLAPRLRTYHG